MDVPASMDEGRFLLSGCTADPSEDGEISDSDDDGLPSFSKILARPKQVIDLTHDDDEDNDGDDDDITEVSWLRNTRTARHRVRLIAPSLKDRSQIADQLPSPPAVLSVKVTRARCRRFYNVIYSG